MSHPFPICFPISNHPGFLVLKRSWNMFLSLSHRRLTHTVLCDTRYHTRLSSTRPLPPSTVLVVFRWLIHAKRLLCIKECYPDMRALGSGFNPPITYVLIELAVLLSAHPAHCHPSVNVYPSTIIVHSIDSPPDLQGQRLHMYLLN